jgi:predicted metal-binding membrane protein
MNGNEAANLVNIFPSIGAVLNSAFCGLLIKILNNILMFCLFILINWEFTSENHLFFAYLNCKYFMDLVNISTRHDEGNEFLQSSTYYIVYYDQTAGMAAMMFPAIVPMVLLYNKLITNNPSYSSQEIVVLNFPHSFKLILFVGMYLVVWAMTGIVLLFGRSLPMNIIASVPANNNIGIIFGSILIISGIYQFTPLKNKCIGYCESPLSFFMRRWQTGIPGAIKMGTFHGLYRLGCCWPYFLIMVALGWVNLLWMGLFAAIIFGEKMWSKGIWIARGVGIALIVLGISNGMGLITLDDSSKMSMNTETNSTAEMQMSQNSINHGDNVIKTEIGKNLAMTDDMNM